MLVIWKEETRALSCTKGQFFHPAWYYGLCSTIGSVTIPYVNWCQVWHRTLVPTEMIWFQQLHMLYWHLSSSPVTELEVGWHESFNISWNHVELLQRIDIFCVSCNTEVLNHRETNGGDLLTEQSVSRQRERETCLKTGTVAVTGEGTWLEWKRSEGCHSACSRISPWGGERSTESWLQRSVRESLQSHGLDMFVWDSVSSFRTSGAWK